MNDEQGTERPADAGRLQQPVGRPGPKRDHACAHPNKVEKHFTYGYRWHCPDCKAGGESWWD